MENVQLQFCETLLGVESQTQNNLVYSELGRLPLKVTRLAHVIKFGLKVTQSQEHKYNKQIYNVMLSDFNLHPNVVNWATTVKNILKFLALLKFSDNNVVTTMW